MRSSRTAIATPPEFVGLSTAMPFEEQNGRVFAVTDQSGLGRESRCMSNVGERANVIVNKDQKKFASAHDLRRAFGTRWAARVAPAVLQQLMRHESIETTMKYYVEQDADAISYILWKADENAIKRTSANYGNAIRDR